MRCSSDSSSRSMMSSSNRMSTTSTATGTTTTRRCGGRGVGFTLRTEGRRHSVPTVACIVAITPLRSPHRAADAPTMMRFNVAVLTVRASAAALAAPLVACRTTSGRRPLRSAGSHCCVTRLQRYHYGHGLKIGRERSMMSRRSGGAASTWNGFAAPSRTNPHAIFECFLTYSVYICIIIPFAAFNSSVVGPIGLNCRMPGSPISASQLGNLTP